MNDSDTHPWTRLSTDANGDGSFTISDLQTWGLDLLVLPGNTVLYWLLTYLPGAARFLELGDGDYDGPIAIGLSVVLWLLALVVLGIGLDAIRNFDRNLTAFVASRIAEGRRQLRVFKRRASVWIAALTKGHGKADGLRVEPLMLEPTERAVLRCLTGIDDGAVMTFAELSAQLNRPVRDVKSAYGRLRELELIEHGRDRQARHEGLRITTAGQMYLLGS
jgi:hypothetical protein